MEIRKHSPAADFFRRNGLALLLTGGLFALVYAVVFNFRSGDSDYIDHLIWAIGMSPDAVLASFYNGSERLWHICVKLLFPGLTNNMWAAAATVTATADCAAYFLVYKSLESAVSEKFPRWLLALLTVSVFIVNALTLPGQSFYTGKGAVNTWHNPTNIMVRPFAAAIFYMTVRIYNRRRYGCHKALVPPTENGRSFPFQGSFFSQFRQPVYTTAELILYPLCLLFSAYAKPSFLQFFAPAILVFLLIDVIRTRGMLLPFCIKLALAYLPAGYILLSQFFSFFGSAGIATGAAVQAAAESSSAGVALYFIQSSYSSFGDFLSAFGGVLGEFLLLCAFPLFVLLTDARRAFGSTNTRLGITCVGIGWLESLLLHETGSRAAHGNFLWGYYVSVWTLWCSAVGHFVLLLAEPEKTLRKKLCCWGGAVLLLWHLSGGIAYLVKILQTGQYFF